MFSLKNLKKFQIISNTGALHTVDDLIKITNKLKSFFKKKKLILFICNNEEHSLLFYVANIILKNCLIPISPNISNDSLKKIIKNFKPDIIFAKKLLYLKEYALREYFGDYKIFEIKKLNPPIHKDLSLLLSTSGSSGNSKFVKLTYQNIFTNAQAIKKYLKLGSSDSTITTLPLNYSYGISVINSHLVADAKIHANKLTFFDMEFWKKIKLLKISNLSGVPFHYEILHRIGLDKINFESLKFCTQAGGKLREDLVKIFANKFMKIKKKFFIMYGQTEAAPRISYIDQKTLIKFPNSVGTAIPGGKIFVKIKKNGMGEVCYKGKNVYHGYSTKRADLYKLENIQILKTGDVGYIKKGLLFLTGRITREVKIYGIRVNLDILENYLCAKKIICKCICKNNKIYIFVLSIKFKETIIKNLINKDFDVNINSINFLIVKKFPLLSNKKTDYNKLYENI
jgi:long-chain acyl-CoA synthetase